MKKRVPFLVLFIVCFALAGFFLLCTGIMALSNMAYTNDSFLTEEKSTIKSIKRENDFVYVYVNSQTNPLCFYRNENFANIDAISLLRTGVTVTYKTNETATFTYMNGPESLVATSLKVGSVEIINQETGAFPVYVMSKVTTVFLVLSLIPLAGGIVFLIVFIKRKRR